MTMASEHEHQVGVTTADPKQFVASDDVPCFRVVVTCGDCTGNDPMGCGDGKPWWLEDDAYAPATFTTHTEAEEAIDLADDGSPWEYAIVVAQK